jgi:hypothetical protein
MTWFKVDDGFWSHPKTMYLSADATSLWVRAGSYCGQHLTDGYVDARTIPVLRGSDEAAAELVEAGLWLQAEGGYQFHDWDIYQDSRDSVKSRREAWNERQRRHRAGKKESESPSLLDNSSPIPFHSPATRESRRDTGTDDPAFAAFWALYPRKEGKGAARKAFQKACRNVPAERILEGAGKYAEDPNRDPAYTAHPSTWLNQERWDDAPLPRRAPLTSADKRMERTRNLMEWAAQQDGDEPRALEAW